MAFRDGKINRRLAAATVTALPRGGKLERI
jgi:hypothetical protein